MDPRKLRILLYPAIALTASLLFQVDSAPEPAGSTSGSRQAQGYVVHLDPVTGEFTSTPQRPLPLTSAETLQNAPLTSSQGLTEEFSPVRDGGIMVDLQGRFQNVFVAAFDDSGGVSATCAPGEYPLQGDVAGAK